MPFAHALGGTRYNFDNLATLLARATPLRSGDALAGLAAESAAERVAAQYALADLPLVTFLNEAVIPYEDDDVTRLIIDGHDRAAFARVSHLTVGGLRDFLLAAEDVSGLGLTPEMVAAVAKIMRVSDLIAVGAKARVVTRFRNTLGLRGTLSIRLQPNHPTDDARGVAASVLDGLLLGAGDACIGVNPATDNIETVQRLLEMLDMVRGRFDIPTQCCVLSHITTTMLALERGSPVDLVFQSIGGTQGVNESFGVSLGLLAEAHDAASARHPGANVM